MKELAAEPGRFQDYEAFIAVVEAGNLTSAATRLNRSLQSVSRSLASLERQLGVILISRTTRRAQPTETGMAFYQRINAAFNEIQSAHTEVRDMATSLTGKLRIAASALFAARFLVPAIAEFSAQHPSLCFDLRISEHFVEPPMTGADLFFRIGELPSSPMKARRLGSLRRVMVGAPAYFAQHGRPEIPSDLARHISILRRSAQDAKVLSYVGPGGRSEKVIIDGTLESDNLYVVYNAVIAGLGIANMPFWLAQDAIAAGQLEVVLENYSLPPNELHALWPDGPRLPARVRRFVDMFHARMKRELT